MRLLMKLGRQGKNEKDAQGLACVHAHARRPILSYMYVQARLRRSAMPLQSIFVLLALACPVLAAPFRDRRGNVGNLPDQVCTHCPLDRRDRPRVSITRCVIPPVDRSVPALSVFFLLSQLALLSQLTRDAGALGRKLTTVARF